MISISGVVFLLLSHSILTSITNLGSVAPVSGHLTLFLGRCCEHVLTTICGVHVNSQIIKNKNKNK